MHTVAPACVADTHVHRLYAEYAGLPVGVVTQCVQHFASFNQVTWQYCEGASWSDKAATYYERHDDYLFDLLHMDASRAQRRGRYERDGHWPLFCGPGRDVLDFGGGLGFAASLLHDEGKQVTYCDVDGPPANFAHWYFERCGQEGIEVVRTPSRRVALPPGRQWDLVLVDRVLEHVPDAAVTVDALARVLRPGGVLHLMLDPSHPTPSHPMQHRVDVEELLAGSPALRRLVRLDAGPAGCHAFRA